MFNASKKNINYKCTKLEAIQMSKFLKITLSSKPRKLML